MQFFIFGIITLIISCAVCMTASRLHKRTLDMLDVIRAEGLAADQKLAEVTRLEMAAADIDPEDEPYIRLQNGMMGKASEYETRADGQQVRKDRFKVGFGNVVTILVGSRSEYEIDDIVEKVRVIAEAARADYETGGNGTPGSAPVWGPCPASCNGGMISRSEECAVCNGRGEVVVEEPITAAAPAEVTVPVSLTKELPVA